MYDLDRRAYFTTLGELRSLLCEMSDDTMVLTGGAYGSWLHVEHDGSLISFDDESLGADYYDDLINSGVFTSDEPDDLELSFENKQKLEHKKRVS